MSARTHARKATDPAPGLARCPSARRAAQLLPRRAQPPSIHARPTSLRHPSSLRPARPRPAHPARPPPPHPHAPQVWNEQYRNFSMFSQDHAAKALLGWDVDGAQHNAVLDAIKSMRLFNYHQQLQARPEEFKKAQQMLLAAPPTPSFAKQHPQYEGVCMGNRKTCTCGAPFLSA